MPGDSHAFAIDLVRRSHEWAAAYAAREYGRFRARLEARGLLEYLRTLMWREYMLGVHVPAKAMTLLPDDAQDLKLLLARQIQDEWKHSRIFAERVRALGGDDDLARFAPSDTDWKLYHDTYDWGHPVELVTSLNCTGEVMITEMFKIVVDPKRLLVDDRTAQVIRDEILTDEPAALDSLVDPVTAKHLEDDVIPDEGTHIRFGRLILERYCTTAELQQMALRVQQTKMDALKLSHEGLVNRVLAAQ